MNILKEINEDTGNLNQKIIRKWKYEVPSLNAHGFPKIHKLL